MNSNDETSSDLPQVWVDFQFADPQGRVSLNTEGSRRDLKELGLELHEGLRLRVYCDELSTVGTVCWDPDWEWLVQIDWSDL
ncbi:hypothetical protein C5Y96_16680 [Blastopirellula marina]|uniref:Uncharacterized protein n=1 Tax=Blastopirellula marina TaxID=124 RepID=A0A2S8F782_9BACT|nr:hypothetical protein C5Y96_16680 [Blastopirellula marina]RCS48437.1 hypothetical protein DTL36_16700 [Bremerella cremea]